MVVLLIPLLPAAADAPAPRSQVFLGVVPAPPMQWAAAIAPARVRYAALRADYLVDPHGAESAAMDANDNNPLMPASNSPWAMWEATLVAREIVDLDVQVRL